MRKRIAGALVAGLLGVSGGSSAAAELVPPAAGSGGGGDLVLQSENVTHVAQLPEAGPAISMAFSSDTPHMYLSTLKGIHVYDIADPAAPMLVGFEPLPHYQNENMSLGERRNGDKFVLVGSTLVAASRAGTDTNSRWVGVVDVTDPTSPQAVASLETDSRTHTVTCVNKACQWAYTDGRAQGVMSIIDLRDWRDPKMAGTYESIVPQGHDQDVDDAGIVWHVGGQGAVALDVSRPTSPVALASTNAQGLGSPDRENDPYNNFILHNSARPNSKRFKSDAAPALRNGNVLLVTEEDTGAGRCGPHLGSFSTWHVPYLSAARYRRDNRNLEPGGGRIAPLDLWYPEDADVYGAFCSAHYFDYNSRGFVAQGWYDLGTRILDVRNPRNIKQVGFFLAPGTNEAWAAYWVPQRNPQGKVTGRPSNLVYTADVVRGVDILEVDLPGGSPRQTREVKVPIISGYEAGASPPASGPSTEWGFACRIARPREAGFPSI